MAIPNKQIRIVLKEELLSICDGNHAAAIVLNQLLYWSDRIKDVDDYITELNQQIEAPNIPLIHGWIYKSSSQLSEELLGLYKDRTIMKALNYLIDKGFLDRRRNPNCKFDKTYQYRVNYLNVIAHLNSKGDTLHGYNVAKFIDASNIDDVSIVRNDGGIVINDTTITEITNRDYNKEFNVITEKDRNSKIFENENPEETLTTKTTPFTESEIEWYEDRIDTLKSQFNSIDQPPIGDIVTGWNYAVTLSRSYKLKIPMDFVNITDLTPDDIDKLTERWSNKTWRREVWHFFEEMAENRYMLGLPEDARDNNQMLPPIDFKTAIASDRPVIRWYRWSSKHSNLL